MHCHILHCFDLTYEGLKYLRPHFFIRCFVVLILPMRDWNQVADRSNDFKHVTFWSYLWGIEIRKVDWIRPGARRSFDLTYEGLKCLLVLSFARGALGFDLTYEGLKLAMIHNLRFNSFCFDLTYEGLKSKPSLNKYPTFYVLILPMRDWNKKGVAGYENDRLVLILPMRDWNSWKATNTP